MFKKLLKQDLKWIFSRQLYIYYLAAFIFAVASHALSGSDTYIGRFIFKLSYAFGPIALLGSVICCISRIISRFRNNFYKDEAYLTHTLPVSRATLFASKIAAAALSLAYAAIVFLICLLIVSDADTISAFTSIFEVPESRRIFITAGLIVIMEFACFVLSSFLAIILAHRSNNNKGTKSAILTVVFYLGLQLLILGLARVVACFVPEFNALFTGGVSVELADVEHILYFIAAAYLVADITLYFAGRNSLVRGVDLE